MKTLALALALTPALLLAGTAIAAPRGDGYRAVGTEPGWSLTIGHGQIRYVGDYGRTRITQRAPKPQIGFAGEMYTTRRLAINIVHARCSDGMSDRTYPDRVMVRIDGRKSVRGCGGAPINMPIPPHHGPGVPALDQSAWTIASVNGLPATTARPTAIRFSNGRIEGNAGCNSFGGAYQQRGIMLQSSRIISTKMACPGPGMTIESKVLHILSGPAQLSFRSDDTLVVSAGGDSMTLSRQRWAR